MAFPSTRQLDNLSNYGEDGHRFWTKSATEIRNGSENIYNFTFIV